jgi:hypothetical protein
VFCTELKGVGRGEQLAADQLVPLFVWHCGSNGTDVSFGPANWKPTEGGPCVLAKRTGVHKNDFSTSPAAMYVYTSRVGPSASDLVELELWYKTGDHFAVASVAGKAEAASSGYSKVSTLGYVWPAPGTANVSTERAPFASGALTVVSPLPASSL